MSTANLDQRQQLHNQQPYEDMKSPFNKVLVIGLGQLGLPVAKYVKERGFDVYGYDISKEAMDHAEKIAATKKAIDFGSEDLEHVTGIANRAHKLTFDPKYYTNEPTSTFDCRVCLWVFESKWELDIHNCLEHIIINHLEHKGNLEDHHIVQE